MYYNIWMRVRIKLNLRKTSESLMGIEPVTFWLPVRCSNQPRIHMRKGKTRWRERARGCFPNPQPSDLRCGWDTIYLTASHFIYIYGKLSVAKRRRLLSLFDPHSPFISLLWEWCPWAGLDASHLQVSVDGIVEPETGATSLPITKRQLGVEDLLW